MAETRRPRTYAVIGCGAVGGLYGARLAAAGHSVTFLVRSGADELAGAGLTVISPDGDLHLSPDLFGVATDPAQVEPVDVVMVATKTTASIDPAVTLSPLIDARTTVAVFQNGLGAEERLRSELPAAREIVAGMCFVCVASDGPGQIRHIDYGRVTLAPLGADLEAAEEIGDDLRAAGVETVVSDDMVTERWRKLLWNIPFNGLSTLLQMSTADLLASAPGRGLVVDVMGEVLAAARACGARLDDEAVGTMVAYSEQMVPYAPSMVLDFEAGRPLEHRAIYEAPVAHAARQGVAMGRTEMIGRQLAVIDPAGHPRGRSR